MVPEAPPKMGSGVNEGGAGDTAAAVLRRLATTAFAAAAAAARALLVLPSTPCVKGQGLYGTIHRDRLLLCSRASDSRATDTRCFMNGVGCLNKLLVLPARPRPNVF